MSIIDVEAIVREVLEKVAESNQFNKDEQTFRCSGQSTNGVFMKMEDAVEAADEAQKKLIELSLDKRAKIIEAMRHCILKNAKQIAQLAVEETGLGKYEHKIEKNILAAQKTPGLEDIEPKAYTGDNGFTLVERAPYGIIGAITPSTNPSETVICNGIGMIAAGNAVVFNSHPGAKKVTQLTIELLNKAITEVGGPMNLLTGVGEPTIETGNILMKHPKIRLLVVTGGPQIVQIAMNSGKKVIAAGPGNPPVVVDETADIEQAAKDIVDGASFDNNVLCIAEKEVYAVHSIADCLIEKMVESGGYRLSLKQIEQLMPYISIRNQKGQVHPNKNYVGKNVQSILQSIGIHIDSNIRLAIVEVPKDHPLVHMEQLMPVLPVVRVNNVEEAIEEAFRAEQGNYHTAMIHSTNVDHLTKMARKMNTSILVKNAPSYAGLGMLGEGFTTFTIASPTGEGLTSPISFTRQRRCILKDEFRII